MSIANEISRLQTAKQAMAQKLSTSNVDVTGLTLDEYPQAMANLFDLGCVTNASSKLFYNAVFDSTEIVVNLPNMSTSPTELFRNVTGKNGQPVEHITLNTPYCPNYCSFQCSVKHITLNVQDFSRTTNWGYNFGSGHTEVVDGTPLDLSAWTGNNWVFVNAGTSALREVRFKPNTLMVTPGNFIRLCDKLSDETIASLCNLLHADYPNTIQLHATVKGKLSTIMGRIEEGLFVLDEDGTVSADDFITQTKGWTIA